ncbi:MAG: hypothetical protein JXA92_01405 [candidate division Zixibacteria bacterium]|nr:hypothetical protein [candidate division Zixibacteria bacterium]
MTKEIQRYFKYELALGAAIPMPKQKIDVYPNDQDSVQQFLHALCKAHIGSLGKRDGSWAFGGELAHKVKLSSRPDIVEIFETVEELGIIEKAAPDQVVVKDEDASFIPYQLSKSYWEKFDKFAL